MDQALQINIHSHARQVEYVGGHQLVRDQLALDIENFLEVVGESENILGALVVLVVI